MAATPAPVFTPTGAIRIAGQAYPQAVLLPLKGGETTAMIQSYGTPGSVLPVTPVLTTTATQATPGSTTINVASATGLAVGQFMNAAGIPPGTSVTAVNGTAVTISQPTVAALNATPITFFNPISPNSGVAVIPGTPLFIGIGTNTWLAFTGDGGAPSFGLSAPAVMNVAVGS